MTNGTRNSDIDTVSTPLFSDIQSWGEQHISGKTNTKQNSLPKKELNTMQINLSQIIMGAALVGLVVGGIFLTGPTLGMINRGLKNDSLLTMDLPPDEKLAASKVQQYCYPSFMQKIVTGFDEYICMNLRKEEMLIRLKNNNQQNYQVSYSAY